MINSKIERINFLANKSKTQVLTDEEKNEQQLLRKEYIEEFKASLRGTLENTYIQDADGNKTKLKKKTIQ